MIPAKTVAEAPRRTWRNRGGWPRPTRLRYVAFAAAAVLVVGGGCQAANPFGARPAANERLATADVVRGTIAATVNASGTVASPTQSRLAFKTAGRLVQVLVAVGEPVAEGQPLARIDSTDLEVGLLQARATLNGAQAKLDQIRAGVKREDIDAAQAQLDGANVKLNEARTSTQGPEIAAAESRVESARIKLQQLTGGARPEDLAAAQAQLDAANAKLQQLTTPRPEDLAAAQAQLDAANAKLQQLTTPRPEDLAGDQSQVDAAKIKLLQLQNPRPEDIRNAEAALASARAKLQTLSSPRPEDLAAAQAALEQQRTKLAMLVQNPRTARPEDLANATLLVQQAQVAVDKAKADAENPSTAGIGGMSLTQNAADALLQQALINLEMAQNNLKKVQAAGPNDYDINIQHQAFEQAQATLDKLRNPSPSEVQVAQAAVDQAQAQLDKIKNPTFYDLVAAQEVLKQAQAQLDKLLTPAPAELSAAQQAVVQAQSNLDRLRNPSSSDVQAAQQAVVQAQSNLDKLRVPASSDVQAAQQTVVQAQADLDRLRNTGSYAMQTALTAVRQAQANLDSRRTGPTAQDLAIASAAVEQAQAQVKQAETNLAAATLTAPYAGMIGAITANLGENVTTATSVLTLVDTRSVRVDISVDETDVARIQVGQEVDLTFDALRGKHTAGWVEIVSPIANVQQGVVTYQVQIQVDPGQAQGVRPGMTATAGIVTESKQGAILVPNRAIKTLGDSPAVDVLGADGKTASRRVELGLANDQMIEIVSGVSVGDRVVLPTTTLDSSAPPRGLFGGTAATEGGPAGTTGSGPAGLGPQR